MSDTPAASAEAPIRVFLLDDHEVVRRGLHGLLDAEPDIEVVGEAATAEQALPLGPALRPHVAVLDVRLPDGDGITVCRELRSRMPELACLMLTSFDDENSLVDAIMAGAAGYVLEQIGDPTWSPPCGRSRRGSRCSTPPPPPGSCTHCEFRKLPSRRRTSASPRSPSVSGLSLSSSARA
ncbi:response regulator transcription factor [Streptomyces sp. NBC_00211]